MVTADLLNYVQRKLERGMSPEQIRQALEKRGWPKADVQEALRQVTKPDVRPTLLEAAPEAKDRPSLNEGLLMGLFRIGFAGVFLVNSVVAVVEPDSFVKLMHSSIMGHFVHNFAPFTALIALNDAALGLLLLSGRWQSYVLAWSGLWLLAVTVIKATAL